ncbi:alpha-L-arabinofuranosidase C-terminal domain-containing protein, partial [Bacteroides salyersiae]
MKTWMKTMVQFGGLFSLLSCNQPIDVVTIDLSKEEAEIPSSLYGIFFEEITHSGDGGLYAEMIRNRGFEDGTLPSGTVLKDGKAIAKPLHCYSNDSINHFSIAWSDSLFMEGWEVKCIS